MQSDRVTALAAGADVLIHESTYAEEDAGLAIRGAHSTTRVAAEAAKSAGVRTLLLTHFSSRYESEGAGQLERMLAEARDIFPETYLARDFWTYELGRRPE
jgi:ribonuclease Z